MNDINQQVLDAFQIEHREHLEAIRALMAEVGQQDGSGVESRVEEAFRRAHSMKGGARICALRPVERLGHRLETLFAQVQRGGLRLNRDVVQAVNLALDTTEDWMTALVAQQELPGTDPAIEAIERVLGGAPEAAPESKVQGITERLRAALQVEHKEYLETIRSLLGKAGQSNGELGDDVLAEAFRMAHSLKGAARVADVEVVEQLSARLEAVFSRLRAQTLALDERSCTAIAASLAAVEAEMAALGENRTAARPSQALCALDELLDRTQAQSPPLAGDETITAAAESRRAASQPQAASPAAETVRVATASLDHLVRSAGQLHTESLRQNQVARELQQLSRQVAEMQRQRESLRKVAAASLHRLAMYPEFGRIARYLDTVEDQVRQLSSSTRRVRLLQRRSSWSLATLGRQVQQDVRQTRIAPAESFFQGFRKMVRDLARDESKPVEFSMAGLDVLADRMVLQSLKDPLMHILRNAVTHGIESHQERLQRGKDATGRIALRLDALGARLRILVEDDGRGIDVAAVSAAAVRRGLISSSEAAGQSAEELAKLIFHPGLSTSTTVTELSGGGIGLSVVHEAVTRLQGEVSVQPRPGVGAAIGISVPLSVSTHRLLLVACGTQEFAIPSHAVERLIRIKLDDVETIEGKPVVSIQRELAPMVSLAQLLGTSDAQRPVEGDRLQVVVMRAGNRRLAVVVDACLGERDCLIRDLDGLSSTITRFAGGILLEDGQVALVIHPTHLIEEFKPSQRTATTVSLDRQTTQRRPTVLVVDDSFTTRTLEKTLLESHGYQVRIAVDGAEAFAQLSAEEHGIDLVITDVQMPRLDGFGLLAELKKNARLSALPVILVTSLDNQEDQERGLSLGADAYIVKRKFDHEDLLNTIRQIL